MKRSEINNEIRQAEEFFASFQFKLPKFACWTPAEMRARRNDPKYREIFECNLGWDLTDFGKGKFREEGLFLFTIRNGITGSTRYPKPYAEKIMISRSNQLTGATTDGNRFGNRQEWCVHWNRKPSDSF